MVPFLSRFKPRNTHLGEKKRRSHFAEYRSLFTLDVCCEVSCPQLLDAPLRTTEQPVDVTAVGVGCHLRRYPGGQAHERLRERPVHTEDALEGREAYLHL